MLYSAIKEFSKKISNSTKAAESCGDNPIAKLFIAIKKKGITVKVDPKDQLHVEYGYGYYKKEALIKRVEKLVKIENEWENLDYILFETTEYRLKFRLTLEGYVFCTTQKKEDNSEIIHTVDDNEIPKWIWDLKQLIAETLLH